GIRDLTVTGVQTCALPISFGCDEFELPPPNVEQLAPIYKELEFRRLLDELPTPVAVRETKYRLISKLEELEAFCAEIRRAGAFRSEERRVGKEGRARCWPG